MEERLASIESKLDLLLSKSLPLETAVVKLTTHIDFVEAVYTTIHAPLNYLTKSFNRLASLPEIT